jgi:hypothetical protein
MMTLLISPIISTETIREISVTAIGPWWRLLRLRAIDQRPVAVLVLLWQANLAIAQGERYEVVNTKSN